MTASLPPRVLAVMPQQYVPQCKKHSEVPWGAKCHQRVVLVQLVGSSLIIVDAVPSLTKTPKEEVLESFRERLYVAAKGCKEWLHQWQRARLLV